jgi:hypothetical protein
VRLGDRSRHPGSTGSGYQEIVVIVSQARLLPGWSAAPLELPGYRVCVVWHGRNAKNRLIEWLVEAHCDITRVPGRGAGGCPQGAPENQIIGIPRRHFRLASAWRNECR